MKNEWLKINWRGAFGLLIALCWIPEAGFAVTAGELQGMLENNEKVTVIDIRLPSEFAVSHIPGAINVPAKLVGKKRFPPLGQVVVCGDGIDTVQTFEAVESLNGKAGIQAESLDGGFATWEALNLQDTRKKGLGTENVKLLTYQELKKAAMWNKDIVLVDLRGIGAIGGSSGTGGGSSSGGAGLSGSTTSLAAKFPGLKSIKPALKPGQNGRDGEFSTSSLAGAKAPHAKLYVLIDDGNGESEKYAHHLRAAGIKRVAILAGGEQILRTDGQSGKITKETRGLR